MKADNSCIPLNKADTLPEDKDLNGLNAAIVVLENKNPLPMPKIINGINIDSTEKKFSKAKKNSKHPDKARMHADKKINLSILI